MSDDLVGFSKTNEGGGLDPKATVKLSYQVYGKQLLFEGS